MACGSEATQTGVSIYRFAGWVAGIDEVQLDANPASTSIFTLSGRYAGSNIESLPSGIYVVNGKKVVR